MICLLVFAGCAPPPRGGAPLESINQALESPEIPAVKVEIPPPPPEIRSALIPSPQMLSAVSAPEDEARFDIAASQVPAREFFMSLVEGSPVNMVVHPKVSGEISVDLKNTTIEEVLQVIHNVYGYPYFQTGSIYQVMPAGLQARTFQVNYLNLVRKGVSQTRVSSGQVTDSNSSDDSSKGTVSGSQIDTESIADFWPELRGAIQGLIGSDGGRKVIVQPQASVVVVVAMPDEIRLVEDYLKMIQSNLHRQVLIEAKVIEVNLSDGFQAGINWSALAETDSGKSTLIGQTGGGSVFSSGFSESSGNSGNLTPGGILPNGLDSLAFGGVFSLALNFKDFQGFVEMLESQGDVQVLSSPRISTINNQKAVIKVGSDEFFVTDISSDSTTGTSTTTSSDITLTPFFSGIALDVTPQIDANGGITLHIHPTVSEVVDQTKQISAFGVDQSIPLALSTIRESDSVVYARSGQLIVIGGLMKENMVLDESGIPILSKIPGLGALFRHTKSSSRKSELVILLRPQVIGGSADWEASLDASKQRIKQIAPQFQQNWRQF
ncbi:MAG: pilus (MSHA type) biogenesis protein MshL [Desulfuromusa sp.]|nr:pilus (MSHA type) biogenesis protein MshL [Desulfuromusa sp.]